MPRDVGLACKKRQHPDGPHLSSSLPKRLLSISEAEIGSSVEDTSISPGTAMSTPHGSLCNSSSSALINSDCRTSIHHASSRMPLDAASSKLEGPSFVLSRLPSDAASSKHEGADWVHPLTPSNVASDNLASLNSTRNSLRQGYGKGIWTYRSGSAKREGIDCEGELSEVTSEKHARTFSSVQDLGGVSGSEKSIHVISRRDVSSLNSKDELWHTVAHDYGDRGSRGKQWESSSKLYGARQKRDRSFFSMACESASSCASEDSISPKQPFPHIYPSVGKESSSTAPFHTQTRAEVLVEPSLQEAKNDNITQRHASSEVVLHPSFTHKAAMEEPSPSYVLSSGRMSLEEEAKLGRRAPTIDHDFEEYFSSLML